MKPSFSFIIRVFLLVVCVSGTTFAQSVQVTERAREHFKAGLAYLEEPSGAKYEEAYREFHTAYAESPSYKILNNIALCSLYLERDGEAIDAYERYLAVAPKAEIPKDKRAQIDSDLKRLKAGLVKLEIRVIPAVATLIDEREAVQGNDVTNRYSIANGTIVLGIHPGSHRITVTAEGYEPQTWEVEAAPATSHAREFKLIELNSAKDHAPVPVAARVSTSPSTVTEPPENPKKKLSPMFYASAIATGVFTASATVTGLLAVSKTNDLERMNKEQANHDDALSAHDDAKRYALFCDISIGATALAAGAAAYFYFTAPKVEKPVASARLRVDIAPVVGGHQTGFVLMGSY